LLAGLDRKVRNAPFVARERGWQPRAVVPVLIVLEGTTARRRIAEHPALFARFALRGRAGASWLRHPLAKPGSARHLADDDVAKSSFSRP
jgi:hypothetical protein